MTRTQNFYTLMPFIVAIIICFVSKYSKLNVSEFLSPITVLSTPHWFSYLWVVTILSCLFVYPLFIHVRLSCAIIVLLICYRWPSIVLSRFVVTFCCCRQFKKRFVDFSLYSFWGLHFLLLFWSDIALFVIVCQYFCSCFFILSRLFCVTFSSLFFVVQLPCFLYSPVNVVEVYSSFVQFFSNNLSQRVFTFYLVFLSRVSTSLCPSCLHFFPVSLVSVIVNSYMSCSCLFFFSVSTPRLFSFSTLFVSSCIV